MTMTALLTLAEAVALEAKWREEQRQQDVRGSLERACTRAGIERITPHVLRHTCASWQVQAGVPLYSVQRWLGHSTIKMTERYAHLAPEHLREGAMALAGSQRSHEDAGR